MNPRYLIKNPVMFVTAVGAALTTVFCSSKFEFQIALWLWFTVLFANFAEAVAEGRGKAQAESLKKSRTVVEAHKLDGKKEIIVSANVLKKGDCVICRQGDIIPADGEVVEGVASVDESAITGESAPVIRESGGDRSAVTGGTRVISDWIVVRVTAEPGHSFMDHMIALIEGASRQKTPNEVALTAVLAALTIIFLVVVVTLKLFVRDSAGVVLTVPILVALLVCLIPTTIGGLLSAIGIAGMDRLIKRNVIAKSGRSVEAAGDIDVLMLDKTGTITLGNRMATALIAVPGIDLKTLAEAALFASLADETPEGRSIVALVKEKFNIAAETFKSNEMQFIPFSAQTRVSGVDLFNAQGQVLRSIRKGAVDAIAKVLPENFRSEVEKISKQGGTPLAVSENQKILGLIHLKDIVKAGIKERFMELRSMGIRTLMITGDNPLTAAAIAAEAGVDDFVAEATPETKLQRIRDEQKNGNMVAMAGDGTNDSPALAQADVGLAMNTGTQAAREAGNMVDLESNPTKLIEIVEIGKQLLMTRGALTTFSIANDVAKYFAILPAMFGSLYVLPGQTLGPLHALNVMGLHSSQSAILSAVIFNALIIVALIPLALKGVTYRAESAANLLRRNLLIYGLGGLVTPFVGIKLIDLLTVGIGLIK